MSRASLAITPIDKHRTLYNSLFRMNKGVPKVQLFFHICKSICIFCVFLPPSVTVIVVTRIAGVAGTAIMAVVIIVEGEGIVRADTKIDVPLSGNKHIRGVHRDRGDGISGIRDTTDADHW